jgi:hypothetical protein
LAIEGLPEWLHAERISFCERVELGVYRVITLVPVAITIGVFTFLFVFYSYVSASELLL